jgi:hypothetical protein
MYNVQIMAAVKMPFDTCLKKNQVHQIIET